ncbi:MAG: outer membrane protein assembly factor BamD [Chlamydiota bacterium]
MTTRGALIGGVTVLAFAAAFSAPAAAFWRPFKPLSYPTPQEQFEYAESLEKAGNPNGAMDSYQKLVDDFGESALAAEAQFRVAEMLEKTKRYYPAFSAYQVVLDKFPSYPKVNLILDRQFKIGNLFLKGTTVAFLAINPSGSYKRAIAIFQKILSNAPFSELAPNAQYNLGLAYMEKKNYTEASIEFEKVPARYPHSDFIAPAKYQLGVCAYRQAIAAQYDQEAAQEAINKLREYVEEFPADKNAEPAKDMIHELQGRKAGNLYKIGCFYQERDNPRAALIYLQEVVRDYPLTQYGEKARKIAKREERKLESTEAVRQAQDTVNEIERLIASQDSAIGKIRARGRTRWTFWRYVVPRTLTPDETLEVDERREKIRALRERLAQAYLDLKERSALSRNRMTLLDAEALVEKTEEALRATQLELQVAQNKLSEIGALPEAESAIMETAAKGIAAKEERARQQEAALERLRAGLGDIEKASVEEDARIKGYYAQQRAGLAVKGEAGTGDTAAASPARGGWWRLFRFAAMPVPGGQANALAAQPAAPQPLSSPAAPPPAARRWFWPFGGGEARRGEKAGANGEVIYREAEDLLARADGRRLEGKWAEALGDYDRASLALMELRNTLPDYRSREVLQYLRKCQEGLKEMRQESARKQYAELSADLEARIRKNPDDAEALFSLGAICQGYGDAGRAIECFRRVIALQPDNAKAWYTLGIACVARGDFTSAALCLKKAVAGDPRDARARHDLGLVYRELGDYEAARAEFDRALQEDPSFAPAYFSLGRLYQSALGDRAKAAECWEKYLRLRPDAQGAQQIREWIEQQRAPAELKTSTAPGELAP